MNILAVDTTSDVLSLAVANEQRILNRRLIAKGRHEELLPRETERLLKRAGLRLEDVELIVAANGPGSFTGIRVGMTFASILGQTLNRPTVAVTRFEAEAARAAERLFVKPHLPIPTVSRKGGRGVLIGVVLPSRSDEIFYQFFRNVRGVIREHQPPRWVKFTDWAKIFRTISKGKKVLLTGPAVGEAASHLGRLQAVVEVLDGSAVGAESLIAPALERLSRGQAGDFSPLYLKPAYYERAFQK